MRNQKIENEIIKYQKWFDDQLKKELTKKFKNKKPISIYQAVKYALLNGGKRLRPLLLTKTAELYNLKKNDVLPFAFGIEMLHTYSLIHDDLPALDNDDYRRGKLTVHKKFNEALAILAGDALLTLCFEYFCNDKNTNIKPAQIIEAIRILSINSGIDGMVAGQVADLENENKKPKYNTIKFIHEKKTVALLIACIKIGAILSSAPENELKILTNYAYNFGNAFQISDDLLNQLGDSKILGKNTGTDEAKKKMTYIRLFGIDKTKELCENYINNAIKEIQKIKNKNIDFFVELAQFLKFREK
ncbi:MAG TPA: polyprenyl synthetase family protein [bacterium]|nr:polyprenyl synthetase family protein [bacterium]HOL47487.1 polyprenyl synthetase family protein [bacterium]HPQ19591.1 polyprenyl synthetase family protein [bacterium]